MSQYTDKINKIAEEFAEIENYEQLNAFEGRDGMLILHFNHGGKKITFRVDSQYEETEGKAGETVIVPPTNERYIKLFAKYNKETKTMSEWIAEKWKKIKGITVSTD